MARQPNEAHRVTLKPGQWEEIEAHVGARKVSAFIQEAVEAQLEPIRVKRRLAALEQRLPPERTGGDA